MRYALAESVNDGWTTEHFIDTPNGRMSVRMPNFLSVKEHEFRMSVIMQALNQTKVS